MRSETTKCHCAKGTMTQILESDDWNRMRSHTEIHCPIVFLKYGPGDRRPSADRTEKRETSQRAELNRIY